MGFILLEKAIMSLSFQIEAIGMVQAQFKQKFGIPRQPGLVTEAKVSIVLNQEFSQDAVRGLEDFEYIWVHFVFHDAIGEGWSELVRPPRLGGKTKKGIFATRTPHRPNHLGLSLLKLEKVITSKPITLICSGADLLDGTPIVDIKPYIAFVEAKPDAQSGFVDGMPPQLQVVWSLNVQEKLHSKQVNQKLIEQTLAQDPRPAYQNIPERIYFMQVDGFEVRFKIVENVVQIIDLIKL